jgi:hypothetical protein
MVKKLNLQETIAKNMEERNIGEPPIEQTLPGVSISDQKKYKCNVASIRFDQGDYEVLRQIALEQGTTAAAMIRKAVKDIIRDYNKGNEK